MVLRPRSDKDSGSPDECGGSLWAAAEGDGIQKRRDYFPPASFRLAQRRLNRKPAAAGRFNFNTEKQKNCFSLSSEPGRSFVCVFLQNVAFSSQLIKMKFSVFKLVVWYFSVSQQTDILYFFLSTTFFFFPPLICFKALLSWIKASSEETAPKWG